MKDIFLRDMLNFIFRPAFLVIAFALYKLRLKYLFFLNFSMPDGPGLGEERSCCFFFALDDDGAVSFCICIGWTSGVTA